MSKTISHYIAKYDMPGWKKGNRVAATTPENYPDVFEPVYKHDTIAPPGILVMYKGDVKTRIDSIVIQWYESFTAMGYKPFTVLERGTEWSVGEETAQGEIEEFYWDDVQGVWQIKIRSLVTNCYYWLYDLRKLPTRTPICQLPDENGKMVDMYNEDTFWTVASDYNIIPILLRIPAKNWVWVNCFATKAAAEKYVFDNQPFYTRGDVEPLFTAMDREHVSPHMNCLIDTLKEFKETRLKDKT